MKNKLNYIISIHLLFSSLLFSQTTTFGDGAGTQGTQSSFFGHEAGKNNTADNNTFIGVRSGVLNTTGIKNTYIGRQAGRSNTTGGQNTFIGSDAGVSNTTASYNVFIGDGAGYDNKTGSMNTFIGTIAGARNTFGRDNSFYGIQSGYANTTGGYNVFLGSSSGRSNISGSRNVFLGYQAGFRNTSGSNNVFLGRQAGYNELGSNKLYIANSATDIPLVYGDFSSGNVGIATTNPQEKFEVNGNIKAQGAIIKSDDPNNWKPFVVGREVKPGKRNFEFVVSPDSNPEDYLAFGIQDKNGTLRQNIVVQDNHTSIGYRDDSGGEIFKIAHDNREGKNFTFFHMPKSSSRIVVGDYGGYLLDQGHKLIVKSGSALIEGDFITTGNVGIGTTTPDAKLTVKGNIHAEEVKIDLSVPAPDYVFKDSYDLLTIEEVQQHIKDKGHLPNIPSAKEMEANGVELGNMNMKLLEKIEELTLYTIAQEKQLKTQQEKNNQLEARLEKLEKLITKE